MTPIWRVWTIQTWRHTWLPNKWHQQEVVELGLEDVVPLEAGEPQTMLHLVQKIVRTRRTIVMMRNILQNPWVEVVEPEPEGVVLEGVVEVLVALHVHMVVMMIAMEILLETAK